MKWFIVFSLISLSAFSAECEKSFVIYSYGSISSEKGFLKKAADAFEKKYSLEKKCRIEVKIKSVGSAAQLVSQIDLDSKRKVQAADIAVGLDALTFESVKDKVVMSPSFAPSQVQNYAKELPSENGFYPFDFGVYSLMVDTLKLQEHKLEKPKKLSDFFSEKYKKQIILQDPRTSTPGLAWVAFLKNTAQKDWLDQVRKLQPAWLTLAPGWESAYSLFMKGEAPFVWSYTTSEAYHRQKGDVSHRYQAVALAEGAPIQLEGVVILKDSIWAKEFIDFLRSKEIQQEIPLTQYMLPVRTDVKLPESFQGLIRPVPTFVLRLSAKERENMITEWRSALQ